MPHHHPPSPSSNWSHKFHTPLQSGQPCVAPLFSRSRRITPFCSGALSTEEYEAGFAILESSGLARTFSHLAFSDETKETAMVEHLVLFLVGAVPLFLLLFGHRCAACRFPTLVSPSPACPHALRTVCRISPPLTTLIASRRSRRLHGLNSVAEASRRAGWRPQEATGRGMVREAARGSPAWCIRTACFSFVAATRAYRTEKGSRCAL